MTAGGSFVGGTLHGNPLVVLGLLMELSVVALKILSGVLPLTLSRTPSAPRLHDDGRHVCVRHLHHQLHKTTGARCALGSTGLSVTANPPTNSRCVLVCR